MKLTNPSRIGIAIFALAAALPALADTQFRVRRMTRDDVPLGKGQCDIRLQVDGEAEVSVRRDTVFIRTISGRDPYDDGSECNAPLPDRDPRGFNFEVKDSRNEIRLLSEPSRRNGFSAVVLIRDSSSGQGRYHFRLSWEMTGSDYRGEFRDNPARPDFDDRGRGRPAMPGFSWNNAISFHGDGRGSAVVNNFGERRLRDVNMEIDRGGKILISFRAERGGALSFSGAVIGREGGRLKADVVSDDRRYRGPMYISVDDRQNVNAVSLEATDGRDRLHLNWDRR